MQGIRDLIQFSSSFVNYVKQLFFFFYFFSAIFYDLLLDTSTVGFCKSTNGLIIGLYTNCDK